MVSSLGATPEMKLELVKAYNFHKELDELALRESKKKFLFFHRRIVSEEDETAESGKALDELHPQDSLFMAYVEEHSQTQNSLLSIFDKSKRLVGDERLQNKMNHILERRLEAVQNYLFKEKQTDPNRFRIVQPTESKDVAYESLSRMTSNFYLED